MTTANQVFLCRFKKSIWRKKLPKGLIVKKFIEGPGGTLVQDKAYVGEDAWEDDPEPSFQVTSKIDKDAMLSLEEKKELKETLGITGWCPFKSHKLKGDSILCRC